MEYKCPSRESSAFLCDRVAEYQVNGTVWCNAHARRVIERQMQEQSQHDARERVKSAAM